LVQFARISFPIDSFIGPARILSLIRFALIRRKYHLFLVAFSLLDPREDILAAHSEEEEEDSKKKKK
jgi:hypothetical protein